MGYDAPARRSLLNRAWVTVNLLGTAAAIFWVLLAWGLQSECDTPECDDWATADAIAVAVALTAQGAALLHRKRRRAWLAAATLCLGVPLYHSLFV